MWRGTAHRANRRACAIALLAATLYLLATNGVSSAMLGDVRIPDTLQTPAGTLHIRACGVRKTLWIDHYAAALFVPRGASVAALRDRHRAKAVYLRFIETRYLPEEIPSEWRHAVERYLDSRAMERLQRIYRSLAPGDVITIVYTPARGVTVAMNGKSLLRLRGDGLVRSILHTWAGREPLSEKLRELEAKHACGPSRSALRDAAAYP
jgi:hypothetical protein